jgi:HSP20 family molecular chaperone IbpA
MLIFDDFFDITSRTYPPLLSGRTTFPSSYNSLPINISSTSTHYIIRTELPGIPQNQISVDINEDGLLDIRAERRSKEDKEKTKNEEDEIVKETWALGGKLQRNIKFPKEYIDIDGVKAELNNGELIIKVPKKKTQDEQDPKRRNIKIIKGKL